MICAHLRDAGDPPAQTTDGCQGCLAENRSDWVHLRKCMACGYMGCCDSSPRQHATLHFEETGHPVMQSAQPGESWRWCYVDEVVG
jgi:uncharacterized UBP type Zn finger protein